MLKDLLTIAVISGMRLRRSDVKRLDDQSKKFRISAEDSPDTDRLSHALRMIGAHVDKTGIVLLGIQRDKGLFTVWHKARNGDRLNEIFSKQIFMIYGYTFTNREKL
jgi:hypothetical protein